MAWSAAQITAVRGLVDDTSTSHQARAEVPQNERDSSRTVFQVLYYPIVPGSVYLTTGTTVRTQSGFTVDNTNGLLTFTAAPTGTENPWYVDYYWQWLTDTDFTTFLDQASYDIGYSPSDTVPSGLTNAFNLYAASHFYQRMAARYASRFNSTGGGQGQSVDVVTANYLNLAKEKKAEADAMKMAFYERHGQRSAPASVSVAPSIAPYTPVR
jgi:hypothetical protein